MELGVLCQQIIQYYEHIKTVYRNHPVLRCHHCTCGCAAVSPCPYQSGMHKIFYLNCSLNMLFYTCHTFSSTKRNRLIIDSSVLVINVTNFVDRQTGDQKCVFIYIMAMCTGNTERITVNPLNAELNPICQ